MPLRPYQTECLKAVQRYAAENILSQLIVLPTASGKTRIVSELPRILQIPAWQSTLFIVQSDELATQAKQSFLSVDPNLRVEIEMGDRRADPESDVIVASIQTLSVPGRREKFDPARFRLIIQDEAHHCVSRTSLEALEYFRALKGCANRDPNVLLIGLTATPSRSDTRGLEKVFSKIVFQRSIRKMIDDGWLADLTVYRIATNSDISKVRSTAGDFSKKPLENAVNTPERNALVVKKYLEFGAGLPFLAFTVDVQHSNDLAETFQRNGISCKAVSGKTPMGERRASVAAFESGELPGLISCAVFREGFDAPRATIGLMAAPSESSLVYTQEVGRLLRPFPAPEAKATHTGYVKDHAVILDFADFAGSHRLFNAATLFGLNADFDMQGKAARKVIEEVEALEKQNPSLDLRSYANLADVNAAAQRIDVFSPAGVSMVTKRLSRFAWLKQDEDVFRLSLPNKGVLWVEVDQLGQSMVYSKHNGTRIPEQEFETVEEAFAYADSLVPMDVIGATLRDARWRKAPPSEPQCSFLYRLDKGLREKFPSAGAYFSYAKRKFYAKDKCYNKGALSQRIEILKHKQQEAKSV